MSDNLVIAQAIAARFATVSVPSGQPALVACTEQLPVGVGGSLPCVFVFPPSEPDIQLAMSTRLKLQTYPVRFLLVAEPSDPTDITALYGWVKAFQDLVVTASQLGGTAGVAFAWMASSVPGVITYAGAEYLGLEMAVNVKISEAVSPAA